MEDQWTTIDRKTSKKKTSREESKDEGEGWEQVGDTNMVIICATQEQNGISALKYI